jgi:hypothetical protein
VTMALYRAKDLDAAIELTNNIQSYQVCRARVRSCVWSRCVCVWPRPSQAVAMAWLKARPGLPPRWPALLLTLPLPPGHAHARKRTRMRTYTHTHTHVWTDVLCC